MTIASEITRLQWAKSDIQISIWNKWVAVPSSAKLDEYSSYIDQIQTCWWDDILSYMSGILSIDSGSIHIYDSDRVNNRYWDYSWKDWNTLYLVKPYEYDNYSSSWHSYMETYVYCIALPKWWTATTNYNPMMYEGSYYSSTSIDYYYINWNSISFYWKTWEYSYTPWCRTLTYSNWSWSMTSSAWDWNTPSVTWWNQDIMYSTVVWSLSWKWDFIYKWKPY